MRGYLDHLQAEGRAPRTRAKALTVLRRFCRWAVDEGLLRRNPVSGVERPTVIALAPTELTPDQRFVLCQLMERAGSPRLAAIMALGYWAGLRIGEVAVLRVADCDLNQRAGSIRLVEAKGGKTRTLDLHNNARRPLHAYLHMDDATRRQCPPADVRDRESPYVFTGQRAAWLRRQGRPDHLSTRGLMHLWTGLKATATHEEWDLIEDITFHDLRHDWAHRARAAGWLKMGTVGAVELMRSLQGGSHQSTLARAIGELGRIPKTLHLLAVYDDEAYRRRMVTQLNRGESRHSLARAVFHGRKGELRQRYREGEEDQLGALGLVVNMLVLPVSSDIVVHNCFPYLP